MRCSTVHFLVLIVSPLTFECQYVNSGGVGRRASAYLRPSFFILSVYSGYLVLVGLLTNFFFQTLGLHLAPHTSREVKSQRWEEELWEEQEEHGVA